MTLNHFRYPRDADGSPTFRDSLVAFLDILGASALSMGPNAEKALVDLDAVLAAAREQAGRSITISVSWFSDSIVMAAPVDPEEDFEEVWTWVATAVRRVQAAVAKSGVFARGAITLGPFFMDENFAFGPALTRAVGLERVARYPRVILAPEVLSLAMGAQVGRDYFDPVPFEWMVARDAQEIHFINYLTEFFDYNQAGLSLDGLRDLSAHRSTLEVMLREHRASPEVLEKYLWLADYHDSFIEHWLRPELGTYANRLSTMNVPAEARHRAMRPIRRGLALGADPWPAESDR